jgi:hypothetical protein
MWHEWRTDIQQVSRERKGPWNYVTRAPNVSVERVGGCCYCVVGGVLLLLSSQATASVGLGPFYIYAAESIYDIMRCCWCCVCVHIILYYTQPRRILHWVGHIICTADGYIIIIIIEELNGFSLGDNDIPQPSSLSGSTTKTSCVGIAAPLLSLILCGACTCAADVTMKRMVVAHWNVPN